MFTITAFHGIIIIIIYRIFREEFMNKHLSSYWIFYTVANAGNISKAAKELYISQPAISKSIQKLEENLGCKLFS